MNNQLKFNDSQNAFVTYPSSFIEQIEAKGIYSAECLELSPNYLDQFLDLQYQQDKLIKLGKDYSLIEKAISNLPREQSWKDQAPNIVTTVGKNLMLTNSLATNTPTLVGPYMGLISSVSYTGVPVVGDTMASHSTWYEVSATTYFPTVAARIIAAWASAGSGSIALSSALSFTIITNAGTIKGCFMVFGTGAVTTLGSTAGTLLSAGVFTGGDQVVSVGAVVNVSYSIGL